MELSEQQTQARPLFCASKNVVRGGGKKKTNQQKIGDNIGREKKRNEEKKTSFLYVPYYLEQGP